MTTAQIAWLVAALALIALETIVPEAFMLWLGLAAGTVFIAVLGYPELPIVWQSVLFVAMGFAFVGVYLKFLRGRLDEPSDQPLLNRRGEQLVGQVFPLEQPIVDGRGRLKIGDAFWVAEGPDLGAGVRVRIVAVRGMSLQVEPAG